LKQQKGSNAMATSQREERELLGHDAFAMIAPTHQPVIATLPPEELRAIATRLRAEHAKLRDLIREGRRAKRGKGDARAAATAEAGKAKGTNSDASGDGMGRGVEAQHALFDVLIRSRK
jgi:hypothetical protein